MVHTKGVGWALRWVIVRVNRRNQLRDTAKDATPNLLVLSH
ncbi:hypothetical protein [Nitrosomonas sp.]